RDLTELYSHVHPEDLIKFGLIPEFVGRLPITVTLNELQVDDLQRIILEPKNSIIRQYQASLELDDVELEFQDDAIRAIAEQAISRRTGARGLRSIVESVMIDIMYDIPSIKGKKKVVITRDVIENSEKPEVITLRKSA
ncbi:MAG: ATP-dependent Clp protease ATP-binding subunit ClpX, partial [Spirochaetota bacterium]